MNLVYLYTKINRNLKESEINLDSNIRFRFDGECLRVEEIEIIPEGFFTTGSYEKGVVDSVSAIVGENGSGKTSIARYIAEIISEKSSARKFIAIFQIRDEYVAVYNERYVRRSVFDEVERLMPQLRCYTYAQFEASFLYISPHYTVEPVIKNDGERVFDYSTTGLMRDNNNVWHGMWRPQNYSANEYLRALSVIAAYIQTDDAPTEPAEILSRSGVFIKIKRSALALQKYSIAGKQRREVLDHSSYQKVCDIYDRVSRMEHKVGINFVSRLLRAFILTRIKECYLEDSNHQKLIIDRLADVYARLADENRQVGDYHVDELIIDKLYSALGHENYEAVDGFRQMVEAAFELAKSLSVEIGKDTLIVHSESIGIVRDPLMRFVDGYAKCVGTIDFIQFSFSPTLSSGEMSFLGLWGRLYQFFKSKESQHKPYDAIVYLDESETALHPEWQRKLVWYTIWFMEHFAKNARVHIIYATHSPILLSDIPRGNVHFLRGVRDYKFRQLEDLKRLHNTFGANIYELYRLSFFMHEGTIGKFSHDKIKQLIKGVKLGMRDDIDALVNMIGDKMLRCYLQGKYNIKV